MINRYVFVAGLLIFIVFVSYFINFYMVLGYQLSDESTYWADLGDYAGGMLNPFLSFITIVLLIKSLTLQNEANINLKNELKNSEKTEKLRSFETLFFNMINSQKNLFEAFKIDSKTEEGERQLIGVKAVMEIEDEIEKIREGGGSDNEVQQYLVNMDKNDQIFGLSRAFYIMVMMVTQKLSDPEGFSIEDRKAHFLTLVNFTDFAQLRLIMISIQFMDYQSSKYLRSSIEFRAVVEELGLEYELY